jgi:NAD(P)-dependent dehydrogenase (short-subunit alcohol dehydrogenase family)
MAMLNINFKTAFTVARPVFNQLVNQPAGGVLVFVGAKPALDVKSGKEMLGYTLSKSLVLDFADILNAQTFGKPVTCKVIVPSTIDTPTNRIAMPNADFSKWNKPEDIARLLENVMLGTGPADSVIVL